MPAVEKDTGLGTTYERIALARLVERLAADLDVSSVLEGPADGITGIRGLNSVPFAQGGADVEVVLSDPDEVALARRAWRNLRLSDRVTLRTSRDFRLEREGARFDLVWNFNALPQAPEPEALIGDMCEASKRYVLIFVSNTLNYGFPVHRLHHRAASEAWSHGNIEMMNVGRISRMLQERGCRVVRKLLVDVPWWPDIDSPIEEVAATFLPFLKRFVSGSKRLERYTWTADDLPYFDGPKRDDLVRDLERHFFIERRTRSPLRILFAHHRGVLAEKERAHAA
ncbi:MAG: hypothetical protein GF405_07190 [Candidatus Eisenbacteria bacterium]|nr:hypothetical protein [Candidatus Eisenbacteria bacterium]